MAITADENLHIVRGTVDANGTKRPQAKWGYKVTKTGTGEYTITFNNDFAETPSVVATLDGDAWNLLDNVHVTGATIERVTVRTGNSDGNVADRPFHFIATG